MMKLAPMHRTLLYTLGLALCAAPFLAPLPAHAADLQSYFDKATLLKNQWEVSQDNNVVTINNGATLTIDAEGSNNAIKISQSMAQSNLPSLRFTTNSTGHLVIINAINSGVDSSSGGTQSLTSPP